MDEEDDMQNRSEMSLEEISEDQNEITDRSNKKPESGHEGK
jgi:hypothetical protein